MGATSGDNIGLNERARRDRPGSAVHFMRCACGLNDYCLGMHHGLGKAVASGSRRYSLSGLRMAYRRSHDAGIACNTFTSSQTGVLVAGMVVDHRAACVLSIP